MRAPLDLVIAADGDAAPAHTIARTVGRHVRIVENADALWRILQEDRFDAALISDPFDGYRAADHLAVLGGETAPVPLVVLGAYTDPDAADAAGLAGAADYLPVRALDPFRLDQAIRSAVRVHKLAADLRRSEQRRAEALALLSQTVREPLHAMLGVAAAIQSDSVNPMTRHQARRIIEAGRTLTARLDTGPALARTAAPARPQPSLPPAAMVDHHPHSEEHRSLTALRVLVVDDVEINRLIAERILRSLGADVVLAENGAQALERVRTTVFDCILLDMRMPGLSGLEVARRIRAGQSLNPGTPIVAFTADASRQNRAVYEAAGLDGVLAKPYTPDELLGCLAALRRPAHPLPEPVRQAAR